MSQAKLKSGVQENLSLNQNDFQEIELEPIENSSSYTLTWQNLSVSVELKNQSGFWQSLKSKIKCKPEDQDSTTKLIVNNGKYHNINICFKCD